MTATDIRMTKQEHPTSAAHLMLLGLPFMVLIVPQGTTERTLVPELTFVLYLIATVVVAIVQSAWLTPALSVRRHQFQPFLLVVLTNFLLLNPMWSLWQGNAPGRIAMTTLPFVMLSLAYALAMLRPSAGFIARMVAMLSWSGAALGLVVIGNYLVASPVDGQLRSTGLEGVGTLTLPLLPMSGVLLAARALQAGSVRALVLEGAAAVLMLVAILMTVTRAMLGAYLLGVAVATVLMLRHGQYPLRRLIVRRLATGLLMALLAASPMLAPWLERLDPGSEGDVGTILGRIDEYTAFWTAFTDSPLLGQGMGFLATYPSDFDWTLRDSGITVCHSHFFFLAGTGGILGVSLYYGLLGTAFWQLLRRLRGAAKRGSAHLAGAAGLAGSVVAGVSFTLTSTTFTALSYNLFLAVFLIAAVTDWSAE